jgi:antitoxin component of RelBE/YafQ-DinJ toxin-antitoxin module
MGPIKKIKAYVKNLNAAKILNKETRKAIEDAEKGKGLTKAKNAADLFKKLGI